MTPSAAELNVGLIEDNPRFRRSIERLLEHAPGLGHGGSYASAEPALRVAESAQRQGLARPWDLVLMDIELPGLSGIEATRRLKRLWPELPVVVFTVFEEPRVILEAICAGADGYLLKKSSSSEIVAQLRGVVAGGAPLTGGIARALLDLLRATGGGLAGHAAPARLDLTDREQDVLRCLTRGLSYKQAADALGISTDTVRYFIRLVYRKLQVHSVAEAVGRAIREGLV